MKQKVSENHIKAQVKDFLAIKHIFSFPIMQGLGSYAGVPDRVLHFRGRVIYLEIKKPGGKMSENQLAFQEQCRKDGITYWCVDSSEELNELLGDVEFCRILIGEQGNG